MPFMTVDVQYLDSADCAALRAETFDDQYQPGFYGRLSASGYLDCTDWSGPFENEDDARSYVCELYDLCPACEDSTDSEPTCEDCDKYHY